MLVYRLGAEQYIRDLSGTGARLFGGRWNHKGTPLLYTSEHCSLALLEVIVNTPKKLLPDNFHLLKLSVPDDTATDIIHQKDLPHNWHHYPTPDSLGDVGTEWINRNETVACKVPSAIVPHEWNVLLNPAHPGFYNITIKDVSPFSIDSRF